MTAPQTIEQVRNPAAREANLPAVRASFFDLQGFELMQRVAKAFVNTELVPKAYRGNIASCMIALNMAQRMNADPIFIMQNLYDVHGQPSWSSKFLIATVNACGRYTSLKYEWRNEDNPESEDYGCRAWTTEKSTGERLNGVWVTWKMVRAEGWNSRSGSKWKTMPDQMFMYRAAAFWARTNAPELSMGLPTVEEAQDVIDLNPDGSFTVPPTTTSVEELRQQSNRRSRPNVAEDAIDKSAPADRTEDTPADAGAPPSDDAPTFDAIKRDLLKARTVEDLDLARSDIAGLTDEDAKAALNSIATRRIRELSDPEQADKQSTVTRTARAPLNAD